MDSTSNDGVELEYMVSGTGEPVIFIHGAFIADTFELLLAEPSLADRYRLILYHRRGYAGSSRASGQVSIAQQAADCRVVLRHLGADRAHVVGHSYGGAVALQLVQDTPRVVHSLALIEPALMVGSSSAGYRASLEQTAERFREDGAAVVVDEFLRARWPGYHAALDRTLPDAFAQAVIDAEVFFEHELPGLFAWSFGEAEAQSITHPALSVLGGGSNALSPRFEETHHRLLGWLPRAEGAVVPGATHLMPIEDPRGVAEALADFLTRHRIPADAA